MNLRVIFLCLLVSGCTNSTGFKSEPKSSNPKRIGLEQRGNFKIS